MRENDTRRGGAVLGYHRGHQHQQRVGVPEGQHRGRCGHRHRVCMDTC